MLRAGGMAAWTRDQAGKDYVTQESFGHPVALCTAGTLSCGGSTHLAQLSARWLLGGLPHRNLDRLSRPKRSGFCHFHEV